MSVGGRQRVVIIQDASRDVNPGTIRLILQQFSLKAADVLILYGALHQVTNPMGYKIKVDSSSVFGLNPKLVADEVSRKKLDYSNNEEIITISKLCQLEQIEFRVEVHAGPTPKVIAMKAAKTLKPTWLILDRQMKKDQAYFTEKLSCGISRIKRDNTIEELRQPKPKMAPKPKAAEKGSEDNTRSGQVTYDEMIPGSPENGKEEEGRSRSRKKSVLGMSSIDEPSTPPVTSTTARLFYESSCSGTTGPTRVSADPEEEEKSTLAEREAANNAKPPVSPSEIQEEEVTEDSSPKVEEPFRNSICSICNNERPKTEWKRDFTYSELHSATEGFSVKNFLSEGGFGSVYKGDINGMKVAVKQHKSASPDLIDQRILDTHDVHQLFWMVRVAEKCLSKDPKKRLSMEKVVCALDHIIESETGCSSIKEYSPVPSDTISSTRGSSEDDYTGGSSVSTSGTSSVASLPLFLPPLLQSCTSIRNPPTPPMETTCAAPTQQQYESWYEI